MRYHALLVDAGNREEGCTEHGRPGAADLAAVADVLRSYDVGISVVRCTDELAAASCGPEKADFVFVTSESYSDTVAAVAGLRKWLGDLPIILCGIYAEREHAHAVAHSGADLVFNGRKGEGLLFALKTFGIRPRPQAGR